MWARQKVLTCDIIRHTLYLWAHICDEIQLNRQRCRISISIFGFSSCYLQAFNSNAINDKGPKAQSARIADRRSQSQKPAPMAKRLHQTATDHLVRGELWEGGFKSGARDYGYSHSRPNRCRSLFEASLGLWGVVRLAIKLQNNNFYYQLDGDDCGGRLPICDSVCGLK